MKHCRIVMIMIAAVAGMVSLNTVCPAAEMIRLGIAGPHSGDLASQGIPTVRAAELVVKAINANGGILGRQVKLLVEDDVCKPEVAADTAKKLVYEGADFVLGHICSDATKAALNIYRKSETITMSPSVTSPALTQSGAYPNFFRTIAPDDAQAKLAVHFALNRLNMRKIAVLHDRGEYGKRLAAYTKGILEKEGRAVVGLYEEISPGAVDYSSVVKRIRNNRIEAVIFGGYHPEASKIVSQMRKKRMNTVFISGDGVKIDSLVETVGKYADGVYATEPKDVSQNPMAIAAIESHQKAFGSTPGIYFLNAYAAAIALLNAVEKAGSTDYDSVKKALHSVYVDTPLGKIKFDRNGEAMGIGFSLYQVRNNVCVEIK